ncbi:MAG TPA: SDR family NAD(P)-dependent oxidoreductase, partial [Pseudonocardiaceae bacterium]
MNIGIEGRKVLLTGGTKGIGRGIALSFAAAGAQVVTCSRHDDEAARNLAIELKESGGEHHVMVADVSTTSGVEALVDEAVARMGGIDVVIGNAGTISHVPFAKLSIEDWNAVIGSNLTGNYLLVQRALPHLGAGSSVILIGSRSALVGIPLRAHYTASKAGLLGLTRAAAKELGKFG